PTVAARRQHRAIGTEIQAVYNSVIAAEVGHLAAGHLPEPHRAVFAARSQQAAVRSDGDRPDFPKVSLDGNALDAIGDVPRATRAVVSRRIERLAIGAECQGKDFTEMPDREGLLGILSGFNQGDAALRVANRQPLAVRAGSETGGIHARK